MICELVEEEFYVPMKEKELAVLLQVEPSEREELRLLLKELLEEGRLEQTKRGKYVKPESTLLTGTFISNKKGFGFIEVEGQSEDYYVGEAHVKDAFHLDRVQFRPLGRRQGGRMEAEVVKVLQRGMRQVVGTYQKSRSFGFVVPDNAKVASDLFIPEGCSKGAVDGHKVVAEITDYGTGGRRQSPEGRITEILGHINDPGVDILSVVKAFDIPTEFPERVLSQAERVAAAVSESDIAFREDLRGLTMVTIDGEDAKDLDDAVSLVKENGMYYLGVHIADVSNYVQENSALDREALQRGTSVYLVDRVIPMLPHTLSNGICSLNAGENRLALSCLMQIDDGGTVVDYQIKETVINVNRRMSYTSVRKILEDGDEAERREYEALVPMLEQMQELSRLLRKKRSGRGSIDFGFAESKILVDSQGKVTEIKSYERNVATKLIEDFMLLANETVAQHFYWLEAPFVYRTHENPDKEKIQKLSAFIRNFGYYLKSSKEEPHPKELQKLLGKVEGTKEEALISRMVLRSMKQAKYTTECTGHFGLACRYYCHFTSPIRRYPDLQIHRIIKEQLRGRLTRERMEHYRGILEQVCKQSSDTERRADEAEREVEKLKKAEYMEQFIGEAFTGVISGVTDWGLYVELENTVEGLVHVSTIPYDYYYFDESAYEMIGKESGRSFKLGDTVRVRVKAADKLTKTVDFELELEDEM
ncbi:MAG: ribonuclease R [Lachnospiraceae bacterium]|nr:ribonuclease R [Lachnospiraceae bacterium]